MKDNERRMRVRDMDYRSIGMIATLKSGSIEVTGVLDSIEHYDDDTYALVIGGDGYPVEGDSRITLHYDSVMRNIYAMWKAWEGFAEDGKPRIKEPVAS